MNLISQYKGLRRENYILCFGRLVTAMGSMIRPMLTMILSQKLHMQAAAEVAFVVALMGFLTVPANIIGGKMADRFSKKNNIVFLDIISVTSYVICALIPLTKFSILLMFLASTAQSMESPSYNALTADLTVTADRERAYSLQYLGANFGMIITSAVAGFLFARFLWLSFLISGLSIGLSSVLIFFFINNIKPEKEVGVEASYQASRHGESLWAVIKENKIILLFILTISGYGAMYQMYNYLVPLELVKIHGDTGAVIYGTITSVNCIIVVVFTPIFTRLLRSLSEPMKTACGYLMMIIGYGIFIRFMGYIPFYYVAMIVMTWGEVANMLAESPYLTRRVPVSHRGRVNGLLEVFRVAVMSGFQMIIGGIYDGAGSGVAWILVLLTGGIFLAFTGILAVRDKKRYKALYRSF